MQGMNSTASELHPRLAEINATCPAYYAAVADEYIALLSHRASAHIAMRDCFYCPVSPDVPASFIGTLSDEPSRGERMLVRSLARIPSV